MRADILLIGNEGFRIDTGSQHIYIDPFYGAVPGVAGSRSVKAKDVTEADLLLITHSHWDHFRINEVTDVAKRTGAPVVGPADVTGRLRKYLPSEQLVEMEVPLTKGPEPFAATQSQVAGAKITAFRTDHGSKHNSYLVDTGNFRFFHDGDNEDTQRVDVAALGKLDALLIGPWRGSGWVEFIEAVAAQRWFVMHMTDEELDEIETGGFWPRVCDHVPGGLVVLRPGQSYAFE